ncbi:HAMP domain-containing sensor histidine kinase [Desulfosporosinus youngiae]|uniref:histidine kinase n=1 Tax=Desulfosporosinus youngiae DSM 17734 TaxID=768710 RepID=H5XW70_9FIRM|nr:HAMP domain-containing sensor histidine kinase [Desulfosporosinus youngiae]EHQ90663.1 signal transduction histidine kinase [Desulfosporosinus youngiae DSM 17734]
MRSNHDFRKFYHRLHQEKLHHEKYRHLKHGEFPDWNYEEFRSMRRSMKFFRPIGFLLTLFLLFLLYYWMGLKAIGVIFALILITKEMVHFTFYRRLEKKVFKPIEQLKNGFTEIGQGNYNVSIQPEVQNEFAQLIHSFNEMALKLQESERINQEYEENRKNLVANISHDLKTPITSIQGYLEMIMEGYVTQPEQLNPYLKTIYSNTVYMNKLIDDLFLFSKLDMDKLNMNYEILNIQAYLEDLAIELKFEFEEKQLEFSYRDQTDQDYPVRIDGKRVYQAIRNIVDNAVKYGSEQDLKVVMELSEQEEYVCINIADNGPGIPADRLPHIFDRFYRIDLERSKDFVSTGLGLAIAKELIEAQGGKIAVVSISGEGSRFTIKLPVQK